jgi:hypothetical protein
MRRTFMSISTTLFRTSAILFSAAAAEAACAAVLETQSNPVPNGFIQIDGDYSDWAALPDYQADTVGDTSAGGLGDGVDILHGAVAHDANFIYVLWRNAGPGGITNFSNWVWFNMDNNPATGRTDMFGITTPLSRGAEYNLGGLQGWNQWGPTGEFTGGAAGRLVAAGTSSGTGDPDFLEYSISRTAQQPGGVTFNPTGGTTFDFFFVTEATTTSDTYPNTHTTDWFTYDTAGTYNPGAPGDGDGDGDVDINDYLAIRANSFTNQLLGRNGDVNDDAFVDFDDFREWKVNFPGGAAAADAAIAALGVPEPASIVLSGMAAVFLLVRAGRKANR